MPVQFPTARVALQFIKNVYKSLAYARAKAYGARRAVDYKNVLKSLAYASANSYGARRIIKVLPLMRHKIYLKVCVTFLLPCLKDLLFS
jgi:hypothetical protein